MSYAWDPVAHMNAHRALLPASGGRRYSRKAKRQPAPRKGTTQRRELEQWLAHLNEMREAREETPLLAPGETLDDLAGCFGLGHDAPTAAKTSGPQLAGRGPCHRSTRGPLGHQGVTMTAKHTTEAETPERRAVIYLLRNGLASPAEAAMLAGVTPQVVNYWINAAGIDWRKARNSRLAKEFRAAIKRKEKP
jgi:hypothetical protein